MTLSRRVQILVENDQYVRLEREARRRGGSVASVVRDAVDRMLPPEGGLTLAEAADLLLDAEPMDVDDWAILKEELASAADPLESA